MFFGCPKCDARIEVPFCEGKFQSPPRCITPQCRNKINFIPERSSAVTVDWQKVRLQEEMDSSDSVRGGVPRIIECELTGDLVDSCVPGDVITVTGIVKVLPANDKRSGKSLFLIYLDANSVDNKKEVSGLSTTLRLSPTDLEAIRDIRAQPELFNLIVNSICPTIYGNQMVKAGLVLSLFGGVPKNIDNPNKMPVRGDVHCLVVGDPGLGKSQMLKAVHLISPRGVYVSGSASTSTGLTVSLVREAGTGDYALEAGALVLGDQGCVCIDEFDKMGTESQSLLEAMEQQMISIAKAGILCNLPARTSIIAAANPSGGHYNRSKTVSENLKMNPALLSRFDLIFIILDKPDEEKDQLLSEHIMGLHGAGGSALPQLISSLSQAAPTQREPDSLAAALRYDGRAPIPGELLRKYIAYTKTWVKPVLLPEAANILQAFYLELRTRFKTDATTPITTRQLESLIRLAEARARLELREEVTAMDAQQIVELMKESLFDLFEDEHGMLDFTRITGVSEAAKMKRLIRALELASQSRGSNLFTQAEIQAIIRDRNIGISNFLDMMEKLNQAGYLLRSTGSNWKLVI